MDNLPNRFICAPDVSLPKTEPVGWQAYDVTADGDLMMIGNGINVWDGVPIRLTSDPAFTIDGLEWELRGGDGSTIAVTGDTVYVSDYNTNRIIGFNQPPTGTDSMLWDFAIGAQIWKRTH